MTTGWANPYFTRFEISSPTDSFVTFRVNGVRYITGREDQATEAFAMLRQALSDGNVLLSLVDQRMLALGATRQE